MQHVALGILFVVAVLLLNHNYAPPPIALIANPKEPRAVATARYVVLCRQRSAGTDASLDLKRLPECPEPTVQWFRFGASTRF